MPAQLAFSSAPQTLDARSCSGNLTVQLRDACGAAVPAPANLVFTLTSSATTGDFFSDALCSGKPNPWVLGAGASAINVHYRDTSAGTPTLTVGSSGLSSGTQVETVNCPGGEKSCAAACIPDASCCTNADCATAGPSWVCNAGNTCAPPACPAFPGGCTTFDDYTATSANRTFTISGSAYVPQCMHVTSFQSVTFSMPFNIHPLEQTCGPNLNMSTTTGTSRTFSMGNQFTTYGFRCANHPVFEQGAIKLQ